MTEPRICVPKRLPSALHDASALFAHAANPDNVPLFGLRDLPAARPREIASITSKRWRPGEDIPVGFMGGSTQLQLRVLKAMRRWSEVCNIDFHPVTDLAKAAQRWAFRPGSGSWNYLGTDVLSIPIAQPTGNLGWLTDATDDEEVRRVVVHETGHLLSFEHEAQLGEALGQLVFDKFKVYAYFTGPPNRWSTQDVDDQILTPLSLAGVEHSDFDKRSIMEYWFDPSWIVPPTEIPHTTDLSPTDIAKAQEWYGARGTSPPVPRLALHAPGFRAATIPAGSSSVAFSLTGPPGGLRLVAAALNGPDLGATIAAPGGPPHPISLLGGLGRLSFPGGPLDLTLALGGPAPRAVVVVVVALPE